MKIFKQTLKTFLYVLVFIIIIIISFYAIIGLMIYSLENILMYRGGFKVQVISFNLILTFLICYIYNLYQKYFSNK